MKNNKLRSIKEALSIDFCKIKASLIAILLGLVAAGILIAVSKTNPLAVFYSLVAGSFNKLYYKQTLISIGIYTLAGIAVAISFKAGLFNIGVSGQMLLGGGISAYLGVLAFNHNSTHNVLGLFTPLILASVIGASAAAVAGALKAFFKVHEVVSTILFNWIFYYIIKYLFRFNNLKVHVNNKVNSDRISDYWRIWFRNKSGGGHDAWIVAIIIAIIAVAILFVIVQKSKLGFNIKVIGSNLNAASYSGIKVKLNIILTMTISGFLAGLAGAVLYLGQNVSFPDINGLPNYGFIAIAIALLGFNNPIGILFAATFYSVLDNGASYAQATTGVDQDVLGLIIGVVIYFAAISLVFIHFNPIKNFRMWWFKRFNSSFKEEYKSFTSKLKSTKESHIKVINEAKIKYLESKNESKILMKNSFKEINDIKNNIDYRTDDFEKQELEIRDITFNLKGKLKELGFSAYKEAQIAYKNHIKSIKEDFKTLKENKFQSRKK